MGIQIIGTGSYLPQKVESIQPPSTPANHENSDLALLFSGGQEHRICQDYETPTYMGLQAAKNALANANIDPTTIDAVISYSGVADHETPKDVYGIVREAGCDGAMAWTIDTACASFLTHLHCANALSLAGNKRFLIINSMNWANRAFNKVKKADDPGNLVGDGAGAVVVESIHGRGCIIDILEKTSTSNFDFVKMGSAQVTGNPEYLKFTKNHRIIHRAFSILPETAHELMNRNGLSVNDITWSITHQPGTSAISKWQEMLGIPIERNLNTFQLYGNMSAANIPVTLDYFLNKEPKIKPGDIILSVTAGAGIHCVAALIQY